MRIQHVVVSMDPSQGGPPAVAARIAAAQAAAGHETAIVSHAAPGRENEIDASIRTIPGIERIRLGTVPPGLRFKFFVPKSTAAALREHLRQADVVHLHGVWEPLVWRGSVEARSLGIPYVLTPHGMLDPWSLQQKALKKRIALILAYRSMLDHAGCLHLLNQDEADLIEPLKIKAPRRVIPNGVFLEEIEPLPPAGTFQTKHPELRGRPFILFLSRLHYKKGLDYLADAFARIAQARPDLQLVVAGPDGGARDDFEEKTRAAGLAERTHLVGSLYGRDKFAAMVDAACFCLPSRQEGFSMAITEAMACGCPVVISDACHFPEVAQADAGRVVPLSAEAVAKALQDVLADEAARIAMGKAGRDLVLSRFTWPRIAQQTIEMYGSLDR